MRGAHDADGDFAAIGDEQAADLAGLAHGTGRLVAAAGSGGSGLTIDADRTGVSMPSDATLRSRLLSSRATQGRIDACDRRPWRRGRPPAAELSPKRAAEYHAGLERALRAGEAMLRGGGTSLDAVVAAVQSLEDDPLFNAGRGAVIARERHPASSMPR